MHRRAISLFKPTGFVLLTVGLLLAPGAEAQQVPTLSVCDALENLQKWSGKLVAVHGEVDFTFEVSAVRQRSCPMILEAAGRRWPTAINLAGTSGASPEYAGSADPRSVRFMDTVKGFLVHEYERGNPPLLPPPFEISATFVGVLRTRNAEFWAVHGPAGFGHLNAYPAELEVIAVREVTINGLQSPTSGKTEPK